MTELNISPVDTEAADGAGQSGLRFVCIDIQNFRGLKSVRLPLSNFGCLIGENNSGKSTALQAILAVFPGVRKLTNDDFYLSSEPIRIALSLEDINDRDLERLGPKHRSSMDDVIVDGKLTLVRAGRLSEGGVEQSLLVEKQVSKDPLLREDHIKSLMKGKSGSKLRETVVESIPGLDAVLTEKVTQNGILEQVSKWVKTFPESDLETVDSLLPVGIENALKGFLPEPIYIEAVKDVADVVKTSGSATFGKLLSILQEVVGDHFFDMETQFRDIQRKLSRVEDPESGEIVDHRLEAVQTMESTINEFVNDSFPGVGLKLEVPVPEVKTLLDGASLLADDGYEGPVEGKGDGLKRAVAFAILRAYTKIRGDGLHNSEVSRNHAGYLLLFEEPELFLYPRAQRQLFRALEEFSKKHTVLLTTHSPLFFDADSTQTFVKFVKLEDSNGLSPYSDIHPISLSNLSERQAFQIICQENNNIGFFARKVVLVEGDSDLIVIPYLARLLEPQLGAWDADEQNVAFVRINGKGNIESYRSFFSNFNIPVHVIADLDALNNGFDKLGASTIAIEMHADLMREVSNLSRQMDTELSNRDASRLAARGDAKELWNTVLAAYEKFNEDRTLFTELENAVASFFAFPGRSNRMAILQEPNEVIRPGKDQLLAELARCRIHVLSEGEIENYYRYSGSAKGKVDQAIDYCSQHRSIDEYRRNVGDTKNHLESELRNIFQSIFDT